MSKILPISEYGDLIPLDEFAEAVRTRLLIDYDGHGYPADTRVMDADVRVIPSTFLVLRGALDSRWTHVMWYNR